jgi:hypothetical protein
MNRTIISSRSLSLSLVSTAFAILTRDPTLFVSIAACMSMCVCLPRSASLSFFRLHLSRDLIHLTRPFRSRIRLANSHRRYSLLLGSSAFHSVAGLSFAFVLHSNSSEFLMHFMSSVSLLTSLLPESTPFFDLRFCCVRSVGGQPFALFRYTGSQLFMILTTSIYCLLTFAVARRSSRGFK